MLPFFLFKKTTRHLSNLFSLVFSSGGKGAAKRASAAKETGLSRYNWSLAIKDFAQDGVFNNHTDTPITSVRKANLYEFMTYLNANATERKYVDIINND